MYYTFPLNKNEFLYIKIDSGLFVHFSGLLNDITASWSKDCIEGNLY